MHAVSTAPDRSRPPRHRGGALPPAIILGGGANALSVARSLARLGTEVYAINEDSAPVRYSRACRWLAVRGAAPESWARFLLGGESDRF